MRKWLVTTAMLAAAAVWAGCDVPEYPICPSCADAGADGAPIDVIFDAPRTPEDGCAPEGVEYCNRIDDDCDGNADEGPLQDVGEVCSSNVGECVEGSTECVAGELVCGGGAVLAEPEICDGLDNDCDGVEDNGNPGGGTQCGSQLGECTLGITQCLGGTVECVGGNEGRAELCDGLDNDCDGDFDEDIPQGSSCGFSDVGECVLGNFECVGGTTQCVGSIGPTLELCDALDRDCDGDPINGYDLMNDPQNCGMCGLVCQAPNATAHCPGTGMCAVAICDPDYWDNNGMFVDGCEFGPCTFQSSDEACNQSDDDCDGMVDEALSPPNICDQDGACAGTLPVCTVNGWECVYGGDVETDANGDIIPETLCDDIDNDCDGLVDESRPLKGVSCTDGGTGICEGTGAYICDPMDATGPVICDITNPPGMATSEACNNLDDDCDGMVDEGGQAGLIQEWVDIGGGVEIFKYEATRADATPTAQGLLSDFPCSRPGALPWTNIPQPQAEAKCTSIGARLCTEVEWQRACKGLAAGTTPVPQGGAPNNIAFWEAEDFLVNTPRSAHYWVLDSNLGYSGASAMQALPSNGTSINASIPGSSPSLEYDVNFTQTGTHYVWILGWGSNAGNDDSVHVGINGTVPASAQAIGGFVDSWTWVNSGATINVPSAGIHTIGVYMHEDGFRVDALLLTTNAAFTPNQSNPNGCEWSRSANCTSYSATACNGLDYDFDPNTAGDQDGMLSTGDLANCYTDWGAGGQLFDMSGNVKEWTQARFPGVIPERGGSFTSGADGISCDFNFAIASDTFFFQDLGFRCCR